ncbi:MAG TPA: hypothetical protein VHF89_02725 [Solirubrobacteraceae bacterium]|nr:hypothetical protein [Solirubrobacteraceae bacterium]
MRRTEPTARNLWILGLVTLAIFVVLGIIDRDLTDTGGPGIVSFEVEFTSDNARDTLAEWGEEGRDSAKLSLWLDYAFLVAYAAFFALAVVALCEALGGGWRRFEFLATFPLVGAVCDAIENAGLLMTIGQDGAQPWPLIGGVFAVIKFAFLTPAQLFVLVGFVAWLATRGRRRRAAAG